MNKIVIVEDRLGRGISLAKQFLEFSQEHPELEIEVSDICFFCADTQNAEKEMKKYDDCGFDIKHIILSDFREKMDEYLYSQEERFFLIIDFMLDDDGSGGAPASRVNIRYARNNNRCATNRLWFYTGTGALNEQILGQLVGEEHRLDVLEVNGDKIRLQLEDDALINAMMSCQNVRV